MLDLSWYVRPDRLFSCCRVNGRTKGVARRSFVVLRIKLAHLCCPKNSFLERARAINLYLKAV
jgi:hypothetical protein